MTIQFILLTSVEAPALAEMTFPRYRPLLASSDGSVVALTSVKEGKAIALALAAVPALPSRVELLSIYVNASHRRQVVGRELLAALEVELARRRCREVGTVWMSSMPGAEAFAALLQRQGWFPPQSRMVVYRAELTRLGTASWMNAFASLPEGHVIIPWSDLTPQQIMTLQQAIRFEGWVPPELAPFDFAGKGIDGAVPEQKLNLACVVWGDVVGWNFAHRIDAQTVRISCTYVRPDLQQQLFMLALWREVFVRLVDTEYRNISWAVSVDRSSMVNFNDKYMAPYLSQRSETWGSRKVLSSQSADIS